MNPSAGVRADLAWWWRQLFIGVVFLAVAFGLAMGSFLLYTKVLADAPTATGGVPFKDVLLTVLGIAAIFIGAFGLGAYRLLSYRIERSIVRRTDRSLWLADTRFSVNAGMLYYGIYRISEDSPQEVRRYYLGQAIEDTKRAYQVLQTRLDLTEWEVERLLTIINNNWAYFVLEMESAFRPVSPSEAETARACLDYLEERKTKFIDLTEEIVDTIKKVASRFRPATP